MEQAGVGQGYLLGEVYVHTPLLAAHLCFLFLRDPESDLWITEGSLEPSWGGLERVVSRAAQEGGYLSLLCFFTLFLFLRRGEGVPQLQTKGHALRRVRRGADPQTGSVTHTLSLSTPCLPH